MNVNSLSLHPDAGWILVDQNRLQLRQPDGEHITFDQDVPHIVEVLRSLQCPPGDNPPAQAAGVTTALMELLQARGLLVPATPGTHQLQRLIEQHAVSGGRIDPGDQPSTVNIVGEGKLADLTRQSLGGAGIEYSEEDSALLIAVCDRDDQHFLLDVNTRAVERNQPVLFFRWLQRGFMLGPFSVPGQTACLACADRREMAASLFPDELGAYRASDPALLPRYEGGPGLDTLGAALITRQTMAIVAGSYDLARPGVITTFDPVSLEITHSPVLRLPRCPTCCKRYDQPPRAIRNKI